MHKADPARRLLMFLAAAILAVLVLNEPANAQDTDSAPLSHYGGSTAPEDNCTADRRDLNVEVRWTRSGHGRLEAMAGLHRQLPGVLVDKPTIRSLEIQSRPRGSAKKFRQAAGTHPWRHWRMHQRVRSRSVSLIRRVTFDRSGNDYRVVVVFRVEGRHERVVLPVGNQRHFWHDMSGATFCARWINHSATRVSMLATVYQQRTELTESGRVDYYYLGNWSFPRFSVVDATGMTVGTNATDSIVGTDARTQFEHRESVPREAGQVTAAADYEVYGRTGRFELPVPR